MAEKFLQVIIARKVHSNGGSAAAVSRAEIVRQASCSEATLKRSRAALERFFKVDARAGKATEYTPKPITENEIELAARGLKSTRGAHCEPGHGEPGAHSEVRSVSRGAPSEGHGEPGQRADSAKVPPHPPKNKNIYNNPPNPPRPKSRRDPFGLNATLQAEHQDVWFDADDRLQVANGFEIELLETVGSPEQLRVELDCATERIGPKTPGTVLKAKVRGQIQKQIAFRRDQDRRYQERIAKTPGKQDWRDEEADRRKQLRDALEKVKAEYNG